MKDLDFDELDRAVNSLIANGTDTTKGSAVANNTTETVVVEELPKTPINSHYADSFITDTTPESTDDSDNLPMVIATTSDKPDSTPKPVLRPVVSTNIQSNQSVSPLVSRRSSGRFMDVVHPSSDMRTTLVMPERVSRQGSTVDPGLNTDTSIQPSVSPSIEPKPIIDQTPINPVEPENKWPDPISFKTEVDDQPVAINDEDDDSDIDQINDDITNTLGQTPDVLESPFLSGAKVFKRPLGAFSSEPKTPVAEPPIAVEPELAAVVATSQNVTMASKVDVDAPLPPELQSDLLSIESACEVMDDESVVVDESTPVAAPASIPTPVATPAPVRAAAIVPPARLQPQQQSQPQAQTQIPAKPAISANVNQTPKPTVDGPTSISQQYQEKPNTGDQNSGAIYDTDSYHKAVVQPAKKVSGWLWVLWVALLLAIGAGVGAAIYFFVLPIL